MTINLKRLGSVWDRKQRTEQNSNIQIIESFINSKGESVLDDIIVNQWIDHNGFTSKEAVTNKTDLPSNASRGDLRGVKSESTIYMYNGDDWVKLMDVPVGEIESIKTTLTAVETEVKERFDANRSDIDDSAARAAFNNAMNYKAMSLGMSSTNFANAHGLHHNDNYSTARDMVIMGLEALTYKDLTKVWGRKTYDVPVYGDNKRTIKTDHSIPASSVDNDFIVGGGKTGTLSAHSVYNLLAVAQSKATRDWLLSFVSTEGYDRYDATRYQLNNGVTSLNIGKQVSQHIDNLTNGDFADGLEAWSVGAGNPTLTEKEYHSYPQSIKAWGNTSQQLKRFLNLSVGDIYYVRAYVKCNRYNSGKLGFQFRSSDNLEEGVVQRVTDGWELVSSRVQPTNPTTYFYVGSIESADLDGWVDSVEIINLTTAYGSGNEPSKSTLDGMYTGDIPAEHGVVVEVPKVEHGYNVDNLNVLFEKNADSQIRPASVTKVMTAMVVLDNLMDLNAMIQVESSDSAGGSGSSIYPGDIFRINDALHLLLLESNNTIAKTFERVIGKKIAVEEKYALHKI